MNKIQATYLFVAILSFLAVIATLFFSATASKNPIVFSIGAVFFAINGTIWVYRFAQARKTP